MKKIINGKRYDTETARLVHHYHNGHHGDDFRNCAEDLYRTRSGKYFLHGEGGPMSEYAEPCGDTSIGWGSAITPLSDNEAHAWLEDHEGEAAIEEYFADRVEDA